MQENQVRKALLGILLCLTLALIPLVMERQALVVDESVNRFKDVNKLRPIKTPTVFKRQNIQEVDELVAKAINFRSVSKSIMGVPILKDITLDIYRGEFTMMFAKQIQERLIIAIEDLLTGVLCIICCFILSQTYL
ncbi:hypothetical protein ACJJTC_004001 [Scirpophaga incertulas]